MRLFQYVSLLLISVGLMACASAPRPEMTEYDYSQFARAWASLHTCITKGHIDAETGALGRRYVGSTMSEYQFDPEKLNSKANWYLKNIPEASVETCRELAVSIHKRKQQIDSNNQFVREQQQRDQQLINSTRTVNTYCNKIGNQVMCSSF